MKKRIGVVTLVCTAGILSLSAPAALAGSHLHMATPYIAPRFHNPISGLLPGLYPMASSSNWAGYASTGSNATDVQGQWVVPFASCSGGIQYSSSWVGIDGFQSSSVEQEGTDSDCSGRTPVYYSWYELCCFEPAIQTPMAVNPGDTISAETKYLGSNRFQMILHDLTTGGSFSKTQRFSGATPKRNSAEWIEEAPCGSSCPEPLANFGTIQFSSAQATMSGHTGAINSYPFQSINMVGSCGTKASTSGLGSGGNNFTVTWHCSS